MPVVEADGRLLYDGPSMEDAELVAELVREMGVCRHMLRVHPKEGGPVPSGLCGRVLARMEKDDRRRVVAEVLARYRKALRLVEGREGWRRSDEPSPVPPKHVVRNLLANSLARDFEGARREWSYAGEVIAEGEKGFSRECDLCGPKELMKHNFVIHNVRTERRLQVGSVCVKRFLILAGTSSPEESAAAFDRRTALAVLGRSLAREMAELEMDPVPEKSLVAVMEGLEKAFPQGITEEEAEIVIRSAGAGPKGARIFRALVRKDAAALRGLNVKRMRDKEERRRRIGKVLTTLCRSGAYRVGV